MNRSIKQKISRKNLHGSHDSHPIGDRRADGDATQLNPDAPDRELPSWSDYLSRLGTQVKKVANTPILTDEDKNLRARQSSPDYRVRNSAGDRRISAEQRIARMHAGEAAVPASPDLAVPSQPPVSDYLIRLEGQLTQAAKPKVWSDWFARKPKPSSGSTAAASGSHPVGDQRTHTRRERAAQEKSLIARISLGMWGYYFIAKFGLLWMELIGFHTLENLAFAAFILVPMPTPFLRGIKSVFTALLALTLLYYDSWLPPISRLISQASLLTNFSPGYLLELAMRFISWQVVGLLLASFVVCWVVSRLVRLDAAIVVGILGLGAFHLLPASQVAQQVMPEMDRVMQDFFSKEELRSVLFVAPQADAVPFDVIFVHVCSMSWDDVLAVGLDKHPLWRRFDILLKNFNSAASYSGPAALHLMRAKCGQPEHGGMYQPVADKCYLMSSLQRSGFEENVVLNHDGKFDDFLGQLKMHGHLDTPPLPLNGLEVAQYAFDKSPVYDDLSVLNRWLDTRQKSASARVALYYNTVSMHDGNHFPGTDSAANTMDTYKARLSKFLDELEGFMQKLDQSGRRAVVVMVPEHGAALRGDKKQIAGLREIPTPAITIVPVGIKMVGGNLQRVGDTLAIDKPTSYLAISQIIENMLEQSPFTGNSFVPSDYVVNLPATPFVAQNEVTTVAGYDNHYYLGRGVGKWEPYNEFNKPAR
ncbi:MAG: cellulose biosynthesis protein BcsG [Gallionella sp.]